MPSQQLTDYISSQRAQGVSDEAIHDALIKAGWKEDQVNIGLSFGSRSPIVTHLPLTFALLKEAWEDYKKNFILYFTLHILVIAPSLFFSFLPYFNFRPFISRFLTLFSPTPALVIVVAILFILLIVLTFIYLTVVTAAILYSFSAQKKPTVIEALRIGLRATPALFITGILVTLIYLGGYVLFIIPALLFSFWFVLFPYIVVTEKKKGLAALLTSKAYMAGNILKYFWRAIVFGLLSIPVYVPVILLQDSKIGSVLYDIVLLPLYPIPSIFYFLLYKYLRQMHTGGAIVVTKKQKITYGFFALLGPIGLIALVSWLVWTFSNISRNLPEMSQETSPYVVTDENNGRVIEGLGSPEPALRQARDAVREADARTLQSALNAYYLDNSSYPPTLQDLAPQYILTVRFERTTGEPYEYSSFGNNYSLCILFEDARNLQCYDSLRTVE